MLLPDRLPPRRSEKAAGDGAGWAASIAFRLLTGVHVSLIGALLVWGLMHRSADTAVLGRYSNPYAAILAGMALLFLWTIVAFVKPRSRPAVWLANAYLALYSTLTAIGLVELGLRTIDPWGVSLFDQLPYHMQGMRTHPQLGYEHPRSVAYSLGRNVVRLNSHGLRMDEDIAFEKAPGERRILALGDSVTFGWGVGQGETFSDGLQRQLRQSSMDKWTVINAGVNGYNTEQEVTYFLIRGHRYQPEIVILTYVGNDVEGRIVPNENTLRRHPTWPPSLPELANRIRQMSFVYQLPMFLSEARRRGSARDGPRARTGVTEDPRWPAVARELVRLRDFCTAADIRLLVMMEGNNPSFASAVGSLGIRVLPTDSAFAAVPLERQRVSRLDPHPSKDVHREIARALHAELALRGWLVQR